jgi:polyhydroxybutyrate depolymerase
MPTAIHPTIVRTALSLSIAALLLLSARAQAASAQRRQQSADVHTIVVAGQPRTYLLRVPTAVAQHAQRVPLVIVLHGGGGNGAITERMTSFTTKSNAEGFIVVYPNGSGRLQTGLLTWNAGHCCGYAMEHHVDDVGFISALIDTLIGSYPVDPKRVFVTGMSNGGMMSHQLGVALPNKIAAIAPVVGALFGDERRPAESVSALMFNGMRDEHVPVKGGPPGGRFVGAWDGTPMRPALEQGAFWAAADGCRATPTSRDHGAYVVWQHDCPNGRAVELYLMKESGHAWPGGTAGSAMGDAPSVAVDATDVIWRFFRTHGKP